MQAWMELTTVMLPRAEALPAPCHMACPAGIDVPSYLALVAHGRYEEALEVIRRDNPFAWVCGLICPHPCEKACVRAQLDQPINIRYLKAFVAEWVNNHAGYPCPKPEKPSGHKVAVIGSGPAGLSAAYYLALKGHAVTVFETLPVAGGLLVVGIPEYRLPRWIVRKEVESIQSLGVEIRTGVTVGKDVTLDQLRKEGYEAFFLGIGAHQGFKLGIPGEDSFPQVYDAVSFLRDGNLQGRRKPADRVVVVGGGNSAMDAARTCLRLGCSEVHIAYRRTRLEMPASAHEVEEAMEEGIWFHFLAVPVAIGGSPGQLEYLECLQAELGQPDASGRRRPIPMEGSNFRIETGAVIAAIGQQPDFAQFGENIPVGISPRNLIVTAKPTTQTNVEDVFAGGDAVTGPATVVEAIAAGKQAALDIDRFLSGDGTSSVFTRRRRAMVPFLPVPASEKIGTRRIPLSYLDPAERSKTFDLVEIGYSEESAREEAKRCLRCDSCIRCGACEAVCRDQMLVHALQFKEIGPNERILSDYHRPADLCITCGACALACPTGAMEYFEHQNSRELRLCGTLLNRLETPRCAGCGQPFVPQRYLDYVTGRSDATMGKMVLRKLCPQCARAKRAERFANF